MTELNDNQRKCMELATALVLGTTMEPNETNIKNIGMMAAALNNGAIVLAAVENDQIVLRVLPKQRVQIHRSVSQTHWLTCPSCHSLFESLAWGTNEAWTHCPGCQSELRADATSAPGAQES